MSDDLGCDLILADDVCLPNDGSTTVDEHRPLEGGYAADREDNADGKENKFPLRSTGAEPAYNETPRLSATTPGSEKRVPLKQLSPDPAMSNGFGLQQANGKRARLDLPKQHSRPQSPRTGSPLRQVTMPRVVQSALFPENDRWGALIWISSDFEIRCSRHIY